MEGSVAETCHLGADWYQLRGQGLKLKCFSAVLDHGTHLCIVRNPWAVVLHFN